MARPPRLVGVAEVEIAQRAADGDFADRVEVAERGRLLLELGDGARHLALLERNVALAAIVLWQGELAPTRATSSCALQTGTLLPLSSLSSRSGLLVSGSKVAARSARNRDQA